MDVGCGTGILSMFAVKVPPMILLTRERGRGRERDRERDNNTKERP